MGAYLSLRACLWPRWRPAGYPCRAVPCFRHDTRENQRLVWNETDRSFMLCNLEYICLFLVAQKFHFVCHLFLDGTDHLAFVFSPRSRFIPCSLPIVFNSQSLVFSRLSFSTFFWCAGKNKACAMSFEKCHGRQTVFLKRNSLFLESRVCDYCQGFLALLSFRIHGLLG